MSEKKEKSKKKRDLDKYPALNPRLNARKRGDLLDMDYLKKLNEKELEFLNQFMAEYVSGAFKKTEDGEYSEENFHKTVEERRECYNRNNARNRCGLTSSNAIGLTYRSDNIESFLDKLSSDIFISNPNLLSDKLFDEYEGDYKKMNEDIINEMLKDYERCINPKSNYDFSLAKSNYGKMLISKFKNSEFTKKKN